MTVEPTPAPALVWVNGTLYGTDEARVSPLDHGLVVGDGAFETMKVIGGVPFALTRHMRRLARSLAGLGIAMPDEPGLRDGIAEVIEANGPEVGRLRLTVTSGAGPLGSGRGDAVPTVTLITGPATVWPLTERVAVCPWARNERSPLAGLKTTSYAENVVALAWARERGCGEALFANTAGWLCEGTGTNVFVAFGGRLVTPPLSSGCLAGVTRDLVLELGAAEEDDIAMDRLVSADEVFVTSSTRDVHPVESVDGRALPMCAGPLTAAAAHALAGVETRTLDP
ncbi:MAG: aminotransferase class IV [Acidimicrobiia bacterium]